MKRKKYWVEWDFMTPANEVSELMIDEINDMLEEYNIKINYTWSENDGDNYKKCEDKADIDRVWETESVFEKGTK